MRVNLSPKIKGLLAYILIIIGLLSCINTNNNPMPLIERVFKPINIGSVTIEYSGITSIILIYYGIKNIHNQNKVKLLNSTVKRIIITFVILSVFSRSWVNVLKVYKSYSKDLNTIYCYRDNMKLSIKPIENDKIKIICILELENCSDYKKEFNIKLHVPNYFEKEFKEPTLIGIDDNNKIKTFELNGKERERFEVVFIGDSKKSKKNWGGGANNFKFDLYDKDKEVEFTSNGGL